MTKKQHSRAQLSKQSGFIFLRKETQSLICERKLSYVSMTDVNKNQLYQMNNKANNFWIIN